MVLVASLVVVAIMLMFWRTILVVAVVLMFGLMIVGLHTVTQGSGSSSTWSASSGVSSIG